MTHAQRPQAAVAIGGRSGPVESCRLVAPNEPLPEPPDTFYARHGKRAFDAVASGVLLVVTAPVQAAVALMVARRLGRPVLFRQERPGLEGRTFRMAKFRTMTDERDADGHPLPDDLRMPPFGAFLRSTSLDELPELLNVLRGDMSLVGPRPLLMRYLPHYSQRQARRHTVRPGVTGLAQVTGRNNLSWDDKFELDVQYVQTLSLRFDLQILARTVWNVIARKDVATEGHATAPSFDGLP